MGKDALFFIFLKFLYFFKVVECVFSFIFVCIDLSSCLWIFLSSYSRFCSAKFLFWCEIEIFNF